LLPRRAEPKITKNRVHLDVKAGGAVPDAERRARIEAVGNQLVAAGGSIYRRVDNDEGFWLIMQDPVPLAPAQQASWAARTHRSPSSSRLCMAPGKRVVST
jgi:hypothetical protein